MRTFLPAVFLFFTITVSAQLQLPLQANRVSALFSANGFLFTDFSYMAQYTVPGYSAGQENNATIFAGGFWMGGYDDADQLHLAASTYRQTGDDYWAGPIATNYTNPDYIDRYSKVWPVDRAEIENHIANWDVPGYLVPPSIAYWPGNGNVANGEAAILAPFYDYNNNLIYDPENGDYPLVRGDKAIYMIFNDAAEEHGESGGEALGVELHVMAYGFDMPEDSALNQTVFVNVSVINRSVNNYNEFIFGNFADFDLGAYDDDYVGCDSNLNVFFAYNGDPVDGPTFGNYGSNPPAQGVIFLNRPMHAFKYYNNDFSVTGNPTTGEDFYNYLNGKWIDGTNQTEGGNGYGGAVPMNFMYPGHPMDPDAWTEMREENVPSDRRGMGSIRPVTLNAGDSMCIEMAYLSAFVFDTVNAEGITTDVHALGATEILLRRTVDVIDYYNANYEACQIAYQSNPNYSSIVASDIANNISISPNPANDFIEVQLGGENVIGTIVLLDNQGRRIYESALSGQPSISLEITEYPAGMYNLLIIPESGAILSASFIKH